MTTVGEARILAHIFESAGRDIEIDYRKIDPEKPKECKLHYEDVFNKLVRTIEFIKSKAQSVTWNPGMLRKLKCFSILPESIDDGNKSNIRNGCRACMGCNRAEESNFKAVSLFGYCELTDGGDAPFTSLDRLVGDYAEFHNKYHQVYADSEDRRKSRKFPDGFHPQDGGMLVLGETCHNRALLYSIANNFIFNWIFMADSFVAELKASGKTVKDSKLYYSLEEDAQRIHDSIIALQNLAAHETGSISTDKLAIDPQWWQAIRKLRQGNPKLMDPSMHLPGRMANFYEKLGRRGLAPWDGSLEKRTRASTAKSTSLADALKMHVDTTAGESADCGSVDSESAFSDTAYSSGDSVPVTVPAASVAPRGSCPRQSRKRKQGDAPAAAASSSAPAAASSTAPAAASSSAPAAASAASHDRRATLRIQLLDIKNEMVASNRLAEALTIMEALWELRD